MQKDAIVEEVRKAREEILAECGGDLSKLAQRIRAERDAYSSRLVTIDDLRERKAKASNTVAPENVK